ncbi:hypothetical protein XBFFL1_430005 [Xenorhabdus bovienii str. feltiae Florida]|nr:hypothetical protein XBFFR1_2270025 [Xenorhabdus bovienii str. feltiae France]CDG94323.1 hypothetical protein XBFFL1_430005 [Xenorhabdus bovienii str. feltiae Florida]
MLSNYLNKKTRQFIILKNKNITMLQYASGYKFCVCHELYKVSRV